MLSSLGAAYALLGETPKALTNLREALSILRAVGDSKGEADVLYCLAQTHHDLNQLSEARTDIESALGFVESLRARIPDQQEI